MTAIGEFAQTPKQRAIMVEILAAVDRGEEADYDLLWKAMPWTSSKTREAARSNLKCSVSFLVKWGMLVVTHKKTPSGRRACLSPTFLAYQVFKRQPVVLLP